MLRPSLSADVSSICSMAGNLSVHRRAVNLAPPDMIANVCSSPLTSSRGAIRA
jgi:hypothetical protein